MAEPKNEAAILRGRGQFSRKTERAVPSSIAQPDVIDRQHEAVELVVGSSTARFAIEHTRIESFPDQIADGKAFQQLMEPLETGLRGRFPWVATG